MAVAGRDKYEAVIGLEVHTHLMTRSKLFCGCSTQFGAPPNHNVCPRCMGMPGVLPVLNRKAVELAMRMGIAAHSEIARYSIFDRKSYFYPDLPKGYQISQYETPVCKGGYIDLPANGGEPRRIRLVRIHLEEDAGKNIHAEGASLVDFNRSSVPLVEIVSEPDIRSSAEAAAYLRELRDILIYIEATDGKMEEGAFRCDVNVSVRRRGNEQLGVKSEIKNLNSFRFVENAIEHEIDRQIETLESGGKVLQETHLWDPEREETRPMRSKEYANDYRYFPEPDLPRLVVTREWVDEVRASMRELPSERRTRFMGEYGRYGVTAYDIGVMVRNRPVGNMFDNVLRADPELVRHAKLVANSCIAFVALALAAARAAGKEEFTPPTGSEVAAVLRMVVEDKISLNAAKTAFVEMVKSGKSAAATIDALGLAQVSDEAAIAEACDRVLAAESDNVAQYRAGKQGLFGFFVGKVMKSMGGKANPKVVNNILRKRLDG